MKLFEIYGASDDLVETSGIPGCDEFDAYGGVYDDRNNLIRKELEIQSADGNMKITALYMNSCWSFAIGLTDEDLPFPKWPIKISAHQNGYSTLTEIAVPDDARLVDLD